MGLWQGVPAGWKTWRVVLTRTNGQQSTHYILAGHLENAVQGACEEAGVERGEAGLKVEVVG